ncbi:LysR family transcriptional regulator [Acinetobacter sp. YK3]|uniref:LysR family transcriptional regulator n=1 Tax=Acinetobacter sp. YK3 TaxID=1860097 RepID=UPI00084BDFE9|nr:LysR family transcriptional regulator [Acinetobacter sp. YK3]OEC91457.1 hypothetical protein A9Z07_17055 [Acinetobacter sp. YK3]
MRYSFESLIAFHQVVLTGSFSTAARKLHKSQSTISSLIANLEADSGIRIFERNAKGVSLTKEGAKLLPYVKDVLSAAENLENISSRLMEKTESSITIVLTDLYYIPNHNHILKEFEQLFPDVILECLVAEEEDVLHLILNNRASIGIIRSQTNYPDEIHSCRLSAEAELGIFVSQQHPLLQNKYTHLAQLKNYREIKYGPKILQKNIEQSNKVWSSSSYAFLIDMVELGFGWAILPTNFVELYGSKQIRQLKVNGWPQAHKLDLIWSKVNPLGVVGKWALEQLLYHEY